jgi:periplasmic protein TonB
MDSTLPRRFSQFSGFRLPGWVSLSVAAHLALFSFGGKGAPVNATSHQAVITADISYVAPDPIGLSILSPDTEQLRHETATTLAVHASRVDMPSTPVAMSQQKSERGTDSQTQPAARVPLDLYFSVADVDVGAEPINDVLLHYPSSAYIRRISGVVQFRLFINVGGGLDKVELIDAQPPGTFEKAALNAVTQLKFSPALKYGRAVKSEKTIDVVFDPYQGPGSPTTKQTELSVAEK